ncbi:MAG: hypothetical protein WA975_03385 [Mesorhizobium sp.]
MSRSALTKIEFAAGIVKDDSPLAAEGGWVDSSLIRFVQGRPEVNAGWVKMIASTVQGAPRAVHAWSDLAGLRHLAIGTDKALYAISEDDGGALSMMQLTMMTTASVSVATKNANPSVVIKLRDHPFSVGDTFEVVSHGTLTTGKSLVGTRTVTAVIGPDHFRFTHSESLVGDQNVSGSIRWNASEIFATGGVRAGPGVGFRDDVGTDVGLRFANTAGKGVLVVHPAPHGLRVGEVVTFASVPNFGSPSININGNRTVREIVSPTSYYVTFGTTGSGTTSTTAGTYTWSRAAPADVRAYSLDNFGELLLFSQKGKGLYLWQPGPFDNVVSNGTFDADTDWAKGTGWAISGAANKTAGVASNLSQAATDLRPGYFYDLKFDLARTAGDITFKVYAGETPSLIDVGSPSWNTSGTKTLTFVCPAAPSDIVFVAESDFAGSVDNVELRLSDDPNEITTAPKKVDVMWVDPNSRIVNVAGTVEADGDYNTMVVRNSAQENFRVWVPDENNIADEVVLSRGSRIVNAKVTRQQTLIWTDAALFSQQFIGAFASPYRYQLMGNGCGLIGRNAAAEVNGAAFWLSSNQQFYVFNGQAPLEMDKCRLRKDVVQNIAAGYEDRIFAGINSTASEFWLMYPDARDGTNECSRVAVMNYVDQAQPWWTHKLARTAWLPAGVFRYPIGFAPTGEIYYHENGTTADGQPISAFITSAWFDIEDGDQMLAVYSYWPDFHRQTGNVTIDLSTRLHQNATSGQDASRVAATGTRKLDVRLMGRQARVKLSSSGVDWRLGAQRLQVAKTGALR